MSNVSPFSSIRPVCFIAGPWDTLTTVMGEYGLICDSGVLSSLSITEMLILSLDIISV